MGFNRVGLVVSLVSLVLTGCVTQQQSNNFQSALAANSTSKFISIHGTEVRYRDLSRPPAQSSVSKVKPINQIRPAKTIKKAKSINTSNLSQPDHSVPDKKERPAVQQFQRERLTVSTIKKHNDEDIQKPVKVGDADEFITVEPVQLNEKPAVQRIILKPAKTESHYSFNGRRDNQFQFNRVSPGTKRVGFWEWLFGKRKPEPKPAVIVKVVPKPDPAIVDQPNDVMFKHAKTDQLADGQFEKIIILSEHANTTAVYEVRGTAGYLGDTAERIGRERAEFIKNALINAGVSRTKIQIMEYDASFPGLRGVVTLRDSEAI